MDRGPGVGADGRSEDPSSRKGTGRLRQRPDKEETWAGVHRGERCNRNFLGFHVEDLTGPRGLVKE